jgi:hypothetical protein
MTAAHIVTCGLPEPLLDAVDRAAAAEGLSRAATVRRLLCAGLIERATTTAPATELASVATSWSHQLRIEVDLPGKTTPEAEAELISRRNAAVLSIRCECGAGLTIVGDPPRIGPNGRSPRASHPAQPIGHGVRRVTVDARIDHSATCPAHQTRRIA